MLPVGVTVSLAAFLLAGCTVDEYARRLLEQSTSIGRIWQAMVGTSEQLVAGGTISAARRFTMPDGVEIDVWVLKAAGRTSTQPARGTVLVVHGLCDSKVSYLRLGRALSRRGFDVVLTDLRAHGRSTGRYVTYGALEKDDQKRVMDALLAEKLVAEPVYVFGRSLGASVAILYAAIDPRVRGVVAVTPSRDMPTTCRRFLARNAILLDETTFQKVIARAGKLGRFDPADASVVDAAAKLDCPLLLVHGGADVFVPYTDSEEIFKAAGGPKELEIIPWAGHFGIVYAREEEMVGRVEKVAAGRLKTTTQPAATTRPAK
ncbi:MAG: hypothetical protein B1H04_01430 [Planctomycetales bacterium 4484_123]|nr:MAG: hypothetical protein B1H04_01430 [Planctomycetales bacterium 4484_123]